MSQRKTGRLRKRSILSSALTLVFLLVLAGLVAAGFAGRLAQSGGQRTTAVTQNASTGQSHTTKSIGHHFVVGQRLVYSLDYGSDSSYDLQSLFGQQQTTKQQAAPSSLAQSFETSAQGELTATVIKQEGGPEGGQEGQRVVVAYNLRQPKLRLVANGREVSAQAEAVSAVVSRPLFAEINSQGRVLSVLIEPGAGNLASTFARALLAATQFVTPDESAAGMQNWETLEEDTNGQYAARYESESEDSQAGLSSFRKTRLRYLRPRSQGRPNQPNRPNQVDAPTIIKSSGLMRAGFDFNQGRLVSLKGSESQTIFISGKAVARVNTTLSLNFVRSEKPTAIEMATLRREMESLARQIEAIPLSATSEEAAERNLYRSELGEAKFESLLGDLQKAESAADHRNDRLYLKFKALIYLHPESSVEIGKLIAKANGESFTMRTLTAALGSVGHAQAQQALINALRARSQDKAAVRLLIPALGEVSKPTPLAEEAMLGFAFNSTDAETASMAQLALGTMARSLAATEPDWAKNLVERFLKQLESASSEQAIRQWLLVLGNAGADSGLPVIARLTAHPAPNVRAAAVSSLRWLTDARADELLARVLIADSEAAVRSEAAAAFGYREMTAATFDAQKKAFQKDKSVNVRLALMKNLWRAQTAFPEARTLVETAAAKDESNEVRKQALAVMK